MLLKAFLLLSTYVKTSGKSIGMICMIIRHVKMATWSEIEEKVIFSSKMWSLFARIFDLLEKCDKFFFGPKKIGGKLSKIQTLAFEEGVIDVLSKKVKIIRVRQVEPSIEYLESGKRKRLFKAVARHFPKTK